MNTLKIDTPIEVALLMATLTVPKDTVEHQLLRDWALYTLSSEGCTDMIIKQCNTVSDRIGGCIDQCITNRGADNGQVRSWISSYITNDIFGRMRSKAYSSTISHIDRYTDKVLTVEIPVDLLLELCTNGNGLGQFNMESVMFIRNEINQLGYHNHVLSMIRTNIDKTMQSLKNKMGDENAHAVHDTVWKTMEAMDSKFKK